MKFAVLAPSSLKSYHLPLPRTRYVGESTVAVRNSGPPSVPPRRLSPRSQYSNSQSLHSPNGPQLVLTPASPPHRHQCHHAQFTMTDRVTCGQRDRAGPTQTFSFHSFHYNKPPQQLTVVGAQAPQAHSEKLLLLYFDSLLSLSQSFPRSLFFFHVATFFKFFDTSPNGLFCRMHSSGQSCTMMMMLPAI